MSIELNYAVRSPHSLGMTIGVDHSNPTEHEYLAYMHSDFQTTFFACRAGQIKWRSGCWHHEGLRTTVGDMPIPIKPDFNASSSLASSALLTLTGLAVGDSCKRVLWFGIVGETGKWTVTQYELMVSFGEIISGTWIETAGKRPRL
jgi:hypothetical protein